MKTRMDALFAIVLIFETPGLAQNRLELFDEHSNLDFDPTVTGISSRSFNGAGGGVTVYFLSILGIKTDFIAYGKRTFATTFSALMALTG